MRTAGIVLAGGRSSRMGTPKALLDVGGEPLLVRVVRVLASAVDGPVVVVRSPGQALPAVPADVVEDAVAGRGPLQGIGSGLEALVGRAEVAFVASVDLPLLSAPFVRCVLTACTDVDVALPVVDGFHQPLAAAYRVSLAPLLSQMLAEGAGRPGQLFERCTVRRLDEPALVATESVRNMNTPQDYAEILRTLP